jgi:hypothetical protein
MVFTNMPRMVQPLTPPPPGSQNAEEVSIAALLAAASGASNIDTLDYRQQGILASAIAIVRGMQSRARTMPSELQIGKEMHRVLVELQALPESSVEALAASLSSVSEQWKDRLAPEAAELAPEAPTS